MVFVYVRQWKEAYQLCTDAKAEVYILLYVTWL